MTLDEDIFSSIMSSGLRELKIFELILVIYWHGSVEAIKRDKKFSRSLLELERRTISLYPMANGDLLEEQNIIGRTPPKSPETSQASSSASCRSQAMLGTHCRMCPGVPQIALLPFFEKTNLTYGPFCSRWRCILFKS